MSRGLCFRSVIAAMVIAAPAGLLAQVPGGLAGAWTVIDPAAARQGGGFPTTFTIDVSASSVTIRKDSYGPETYRLDGTPTPLIDGRTGTASVEDGALILTLRRERSQRGARSVTLVREVYRPSADPLMVERLARGERPNEAPTRWVAIQTVPYRRAQPR